MQRDGKKDSRLRRTLLFLILTAAVCMPGCKGCSCRSEPVQKKTAEELLKERQEREKRKREEEAKKKPLRQLRYASLPHGPMGGFPKLGEPPQRQCYLKPGHWSALTFSALANNFDIVGNLELAAGRQTSLPGMPFTMSTRRRAAFSKGQAKTLGMSFYLPEDSLVSMQGTLDARRQSGVSLSLLPPINRMPYWQFHFLVLARYPESYSYLKKLDCISNTSNEHYRLSLISPGRRTPLPNESLFWTATAYILWDNAEPEALSLAQQVALLDWIHWGGQLIVSGPETLETLGASFLADYLPATGEGTRELVASDFDEINQHWNLPIRRMAGPPLRPIGKWSGVKLKMHPEAEYVPTTGDLVAERRIGRGRIVVTAFKLSAEELVSWPSWDGFFNGCLMRRPAREFGQNNLGMDLNEYAVTWKGGDADSRCDTEWLTRLRYFSRDTGRQPNEVQVATPSVAFDDNMGYSQATSNFGSDGLRLVPVMNYGAWNDFNAVADAARTVLSDAAGIEVPDRSFVVWIVAGYLLVLVPLNWLFFRMLGRVEWAWIAAPVIAVICAIVVIRQAQLDIGFVRSETEVAVVELQGDYPRGHVTRYSAYYTSLGTGYDFHFDDPGAQILPFSATGNPKANGLKFGESPQRVRYEYGSEVNLADLRVPSSSAQMTHSEQMLDFGGAIEWQEPAPGMHRVVNRTSYQLRDVGILRKTAEGRLMAAWLGQIDPEDSADLAGRWQPAPGKDEARGPWPDRRDAAPETGPGAAAGTLSLRPLLALAEQADGMEPGDVRMIAWTDEPLPGLDVSPSAPQKRRLALIVANLRYGFGAAPKPDENTRFDFIQWKPVFREGEQGDTTEDPEDTN